MPFSHLFVRKIIFQFLGSSKNFRSEFDAQIVNLEMSSIKNI
jgi:hypothetical protein